MFCVHTRSLLLCYFLLRIRKSKFSCEHEKGLGVHIRKFSREHQKVPQHFLGCATKFTGHRRNSLMCDSFLGKFCCARHNVSGTFRHVLFCMPQKVLRMLSHESQKLCRAQQILLKRPRNMLLSLLRLWKMCRDQSGNYVCNCKPPLCAPCGRAMFVVTSAGENLHQDFMQL